MYNYSDERITPKVFIFCVWGAKFASAELFAEAWKLLKPEESACTLQGW